MCYRQVTIFGPKKEHLVIGLTLLWCARNVRGVEPLVEVDVADPLAGDVRRHGSRKQAADQGKKGDQL